MPSWARRAPGSVNVPHPPGTPPTLNGERLQRFEVTDPTMGIHASNGLRRCSGPWRDLSDAIMDAADSG